MLTHEPGDSPGHRLDPRSKLALQAGFAAAAFAHTTPRGLLALSALAVAGTLACGLSLRSALREYLAVLPFLVLAPVIQALTWGAPWIVPADAVQPALASWRTLLLLLLAAAYVHTTPVSESRAAVAWLVPGRVGRLLGVGTGLVFRFLPLLQRDVRRLRDASRARLGDQRSVRDRVRLVGVGGLRRALQRADRLALALRARCISYNPTPPPLAFAGRDWLAVALTLALVASAYAEPLATTVAALA